MIVAHEPVVFTDPDEVYFASKPLDIPAAPYDIQVARDDDGHIIAAHGSPFEGYRSWMEMALECHLWSLATELVLEMAAGEEIAAQCKRTVLAVECRPSPLDGGAGKNAKAPAEPPSSRALLQLATP
jgi:hypothetical protein